MLLEKANHILRNSQYYLLFREDILLWQSKYIFSGKVSISSLKGMALAWSVYCFSMHFVKLSTVSVNVDKNSLEKYLNINGKVCLDTWAFMFRYFAVYVNILFWVCFVASFPVALTWHNSLKTQKWTRDTTWNEFLSQKRFIFTTFVP